MLQTTAFSVLARAIGNEKADAFWHGSSVTLASIVGQVPAAFNMLWWSTFAQATDFTQSFYQTVNASLTTGIIAPSGSNNAQKLVESTANGNHSVGVPIANPGAPNLISGSSSIWRLACAAKSGERTRIVVSWATFGDANANVSIGFDLIGGNVGYDEVVGTDASLIEATMQAIGNGWWLCLIDFQQTGNLGTGQNFQEHVYLDAGSGTGARDISYTGDGASGAYLWWFNLLPKAAWELTDLTFSDDFTSLSTIDTTDSRASGFNWYVHNAWPNAIGSGGDWGGPATPASSLSISNSVLKIYDANNNATAYTAQLISAATDGANGHVGNVFTPPFLYDCYINWAGNGGGFDSSNGSSGQSWPAIWSFSSNFLSGISRSDYVEIDNAEGIPTTDSGDQLTETVHDSNGSAEVWHATESLIETFTEGVFARCSRLWVLMADNGGTYGLQMSFLNGQFIDNSDVAYGTTVAPQGNGPSAPTGTFADLETDSIALFLTTTPNVTNNAGGGWPIFIDWVKVWQKP